MSHMLTVFPPLTIRLLSSNLEHKFPFSLVSEFKHGLNREISKVGDVSELMDKAIGRLVFRIKGSVSANNYIEFDSLSLVGPIVYIQMCLAKPSIATIHLEVQTTSNIPLRLTLSTLYNGDQPRFLGRSLRYGSDYGLCVGVHTLRVQPSTSHLPCSPFLSSYSQAAAACLSGLDDPRHRSGPGPCELLRVFRARYPHRRAAAAHAQGMLSSSCDAF
jgi:hypothetical protein